MAGRKGMVHYPVEVKLEAVRLFYEDGKTRAEIAEALNLYGDERVKEWVKKYREEGEMAFCKPIGRPRKQAESEQAELERLRMENALLKKYHTELRTQALAKRNIGLSTTIEQNTK
jgi:transposase-like protein